MTLEVPERVDPGPGASLGSAGPAGGWPGRADARVPLLFMASGAAGLIYQVVWTRDLVLVFGNTTQAIVTTVTAFLGGLGIGSLLGAAIGTRLRRALVLYGMLEITVGCLALAMPLAFDVVATVFRSAYLSLPPGEVALIRFALAFCALTPVTLIMGMTLPVLTQYLVRADPEVGGRIARLYGLNTLGAVVGTVVSGFALIELLGLRGTSLVAVALNLSAGAGALLISRNAPRNREPRAASEARQARPLLQRRQRVVLGVTFASGFVSLALEVLWTRVLVQATGSSIYIFVSVLAIYLIGIAAGSLAYEHQRERPAQLTTLGACLAAAAGLTLVPVVVSNIYGPPGLPFVIPLILPVTILLGYAFPLTARLFVAGAAEASRGIGIVYAANTAGCVAGTVTAGFVLIPALGTNTSIVALCIVEAALGGGLAAAFAPRRRAVWAGIGLGLTGVLVLMLGVPVVRLNYTQRQLASGGHATRHFEDNVATVDVVGGARLNRRLLVNGTGITRLTIDTKLLAYIPKALRPQSSSILDICFGMGTTYRSSIILGMRTDVVELDPTVPSVMSWFYPDASHYLHSPLGHVIITDGRNYVRLATKHYDLITVDAPPPVWSAGTVVLMTHEFYQEAKRRLNPGGILGVFLPYSSPANQKLFLRTFRASFAHVTVIRGPSPEPYGMYFLGSDAPMTFRAGVIEKVFGSPAARADLANAPDFGPVPVTAWPAIIARHVWLTDAQVNAYTGAGPLLTDDRPLSEYFLIHGQGGFEQPAVDLALVVTVLLVLLIAGLGAVVTRERLSARALSRRTTSTTREVHRG